MDTLIDKLVPKRTSQGQLRTNGGSDNAKILKLENQIATMSEILQELRRVALKNAENEKKTQQILMDCLQKLDSVSSVENSTMDNTPLMEEIKKELALSQEKYEEHFKQSDEFLHKENVKVYRNVQAALIEELGKQTQELRELTTGQKAKNGNTPVIVLSVFILLGVIADIVIHVLPYFMPL